MAHEGQQPSTIVRPIPVIPVLDLPGETTGTSLKNLTPTLIIPTAIPGFKAFGTPTEVTKACPFVLEVPYFLVSTETTPVNLVIAGTKQAKSLIQNYRNIIGHPRECQQIMRLNGQEVCLENFVKAKDYAGILEALTYLWIAISKFKISLTLKLIHPGEALHTDLNENAAFFHFLSIMQGRNGIKSFIIEFTHAKDLENFSQLRETLANAKIRFQFQVSSINPPTPISLLASQMPEDGDKIVDLTKEPPAKRQKESQQRNLVANVFLQTALPPKVVEFSSGKETSTC